MEEGTEQKVAVKVVQDRVPDLSFGVILVG